MGQEILTAAFVVVVIGGLGSFWGVVVAAMLVGVIRGLTSYFYPPASEASLYLLVLLILVLRPRGLLGEERSEERRVGEEWVSTCQTPWSTAALKKKKKK